MLNRIRDKMQLWSSFCSELLEVAINSDGRRVLIVQRLDEIDKVRNSHVLKHSIEISIWQSRKLWCNRNTEIWYVKFSCFLNDLSQVQYLNSLVPLPGTNPHCSSVISINRKCLSLSLRRILLACGNQRNRCWNNPLESFSCIWVWRVTPLIWPDPRSPILLYKENRDTQLLHYLDRFP